MLTLCPHQVLWFSTSEVAGQWYEPGKYGLFQDAHDEKFPDRSRLE